MSYIQLNHVMKKFGDVIAIEDLNPVSYTHLTLPTN